MKKLSIILAILTVATFIFINTTYKTNGYKVGDTASDFSLKNINGKMVSLKSIKKAKGYIVIFTCNHCPFAVAYEDRIIALSKKYKKKGVHVVAIMPNDVKAYPSDSYENMQKRAKDKGFSFPYLLDDTQKIAQQFGATKTPHVFLLDSKKKVKYIGAIDDSPRDAGAVSKKYLENAVDAMLKGKKINTSTTKAVGCSIKWKK